MGKILGIDLGTTNSEVAIMEAGKPTIIKSAEGQPYFPSVVAFTRRTTIFSICCGIHKRW